MTLAQVVQRLCGYDDELTIWARARTDLTDLAPDTEAIVAPELEDGSVWWEERGLSYVLEVELAKDAIEVWRQDHDGAYLEVDADVPADGPEGRGSGTSEHPPTE